MPLATGDAGRPIDQGASFTISLIYGEATALDNSFWIAPFACRLISARVRPLVVGSDGSAVTATFNKASSGTAIASGTAMTSAADLKGTINTNQTLTLSTTTADCSVAAGQAVGMDCTGVMTAARGTATLEFVRM